MIWKIPLLLQQFVTLLQWIPYSHPTLRFWNRFCQWEGGITKIHTFSPFETSTVESSPCFFPKPSIFRGFECSPHSLSLLSINWCMKHVNGGPGAKWYEKSNSRVFPSHQLHLKAFWFDPGWCPQITCSSFAVVERWGRNLKKESNRLIQKSIDCFPLLDTEVSLCLLRMAS